MPINGLISEYDQINFSLGLTVTGTRNTPSIATLQTLYTPDVIDVAAGITMTATVNPITGCSVTYSDAVGNTYSGSTGASSSIQIDAYFNGVKVYGVNPLGENYLVRFTWTSIQIYLNGTLAATLGSGYMVSTALGPSWIAPFNGLCQITGTFSEQVTTTISGGYRYMIGATWYAPPVAIPAVVDAPIFVTGYNVIAPPDGPPVDTPWSGDAPFGLSTSGIIVSTSTYGAHISMSDATIVDSGSVVLIPNLPKSINRMNTDFAATFFAFAVPQVIGNSSRGVILLNSSLMLDVVAGSTAQTVTSNRAAAGTYEAGNTQSPLEANLFNNTSYSCVNITMKEITSGGGYQSKEEILDTTYPYAMDSIDGGESWSLGAYYMAPYLSHQNIIANYFNTICNPHWWIFYFTGPWCLGSDCAASLSEGVFHIQDGLGRLHIASVIAGDVFYQRADFSNPLNGWATEQTVTSYADVKLARMFVDHEASIRLVIVRKNAGTGALTTYLLSSTDEGASFGNAVEVMSDQIWAQGWDEKSVGAAGITGFTYNSGTSGAGTQSAIYRDGPVGVPWSSVFTFVDNTNTPIPVSDGGWANVQPASDGSRNLTWTPVINGETAASEWLSVDNARTWRRIF